MKKVVKEFNIYTYDELSENVKRKLLEKEIDECINDYCELHLEEDLKNEAQKLIEKYCGQNTRLGSVLYDLSYSQGSGAMVEFTGSYCGKNFSVKNTGRYCHAYSFTIDSEQDFTDKQEQNLKAKIITINEELTRCGYNLIHWDNFTDWAEENLNEKEFLENGEIFE